MWLTWTARKRLWRSHDCFQVFFFQVSQSLIEPGDAKLKKIQITFDLQVKSPGKPGFLNTDRKPPHSCSRTISFRVLPTFSVTRSIVDISKHNLRAQIKHSIPLQTFDSECSFPLGNTVFYDFLCLLIVESFTGNFSTISVKFLFERRVGHSSLPSGHFCRRTKLDCLLDG